eukprot:scaffold1305_cov248-Pinguiococcus_pyrenoidosus.AAC.10
MAAKGMRCSADARAGLVAPEPNWCVGRTSSETHANQRNAAPNARILCAQSDETVESRSRRVDPITCAKNYGMDVKGHVIQ